MDLSISIVSWNTREILDQCLKSIYPATDGINFEVIVVDNASSDGSADMVHHKHPGVKLIENTENVGFAKANNQAYHISKGRYFMLLNSDTKVLSDLRPLVHYLDSHDKVGVVNCLCLNADESVQQNWWDYYPSVFWDMLPEFLRGVLDRLVYRRNPSTGFETKWVGGQCMTLKRSVIENVGTMDPGYFMYSEETDWCFRIAEHGWSINHYPGIRVVHFGGQSTRQASSKMRIELYKSKTRFIAKNCSVHNARLFSVAIQLRVIAAFLLSSVSVTSSRSAWTISDLRGLRSAMKAALL